MKIGTAIRAVRTERGLNQTELATRCSISNSYLSQIESNKQEPSLDTLEQLCKALDVPIYLVLFKAMNEQDIDEPDKKRLVREIRPYMESIINKLYSPID